MDTPESPRPSANRPEPVTIDLAADEVRDIAASEAEGTDEDVTAASAAEAESPAAARDSASDATSAAAVPPPADAPARRAGGLSLIAAGLIGGVVAIGGAAGLQFANLLPSLGSNQEATNALKAVNDQVAALAAKVTTLETAQPEIDLTPVDTRLAAIEKRMETVPAANGLSADADARLAALAEQVKASETGLADATKAAETARAALEMRLEALEKQAAEPRDDVEVALAIASAGLKAAIDRGGPFMSELETLAGINPDDPAVVELQAYAATGVPSRADLIGQFPDVASSMLGAIRAGGPEQSLTDRLLDSAFSAIKVRPVGNVEGEGPDAIVARMEVKLTNGDLKGAALEWDSLPEPGKQASSSFKKALDARIRVEDLVGATLRKAVAGTKTNG